MGAEAVRARKRQLRAFARALAPSPGVSAARAAQRRLLSLPELALPATVALYAPLEGEVPVSEVVLKLAQRGARLAYPRVAGRALTLHLVCAPDELLPGYRGVLEPAPTHPPIAAEAVDVFVVPGLLFDRHGRRLGRGGGFYDRLLRQARPDAQRVGLCYAHRVVEELPETRRDMAVHAVVTEEGVIRPPAREERG